ncbi:MAG TPA: substrate-binding domain-containing protein [Fimbriimonadaceae bacterium]|nr:substrate-binding domain-containing protein [Fimbriimonadaceae bacterium]
MKSVLAIASLGFFLAGCSSPQPSEPAATNSGKKSLRITMIAKSNTNPVFQSAKVGAEAAAADLSKETGWNITVDWRTPDTEDGQVQAQYVAQAVNEGANAVLISCSDAAKVTGAINDAVDKGVPVMTFDSDAPDSKRFAFFGADDIECGQKTMDELAKQLGGKGNVAILAGNQNAPNLQKRVQGAMEAAKKYPGIKIVDTFYHPESPQDATSAVMSAMNANPQINGWAMIGGWPLFAPSLLKDLDPAKVKIVAVDALPEELPYIERGLAPVLFAQPTYEWGYKSVGIIVDKLVKGKDVNPVNKMELVRVSKENLKDWARQLKEWKFEVDPKFLD